MNIEKITWLGPVLIVLCLFISLTWNPAPAPQPADAPADVFSAERAIVHVRNIASAPRPVGTQAHREAGDYLINTLRGMGLEPEIQQLPYLDALHPFRPWTQVRNIMVRLPGSASDKAIMIAAHYDSAPNSLGAADNGAAVGAMLETIRILKSADPLKHDLIFMFTDSEEFGQLGAQAFVENHPWSTNLGLVFNFEARGSSGPVTLFESSPGNAALLASAANAVRDPYGTSVAFEIYKRLPNTTDFGHFMKLNGVQGLNYANIGTPVHYHNLTDSPDNLSLSTLQHHGEHILGLATHFGANGAEAPAATDTVYFNIPILGFFHYSPGLVLPVAIIAVLFLIIVAVISMRSGVVGLGFLGAIPIYLVAIIISAGLGLFFWQALQIQTEMVSGHGFRSLYYLVGGFFLAAAAVTGIFAPFRKKITPESIVLGVAFVFALLALLTALQFPGASYLFSWPIFFIALGPLIIAIKGKEWEAPTKAFVLCLSVLPAILIFTSVIRPIFDALSLDNYLATTLLAGISAGLWLGPYQHQFSQFRWKLVALMFLLGLGSLITVLVRNGSPDKQHPHFTSLVYAADADTNEAFWLSNYGPAFWNAELFEGGTWGSQPKFWPGQDNIKFLAAKAPMTQLIVPQIEVLADEEDDLQRVLVLHIKVPNGRHIKITPRAGMEFYTVNVGDDFLGASFEHFMARGIPEEGLEFTFAFKKGETLDLRINTWKEGLPDITPSTPENAVPASTLSWFQFSTITSKQFSF